MGAVWRRNAPRVPPIVLEPPFPSSPAQDRLANGRRGRLGSVSTLALSGVTTSAHAASSDGCESGGFSLVNLATGAVVAGGRGRSATIPAAQFGTTFAVRGRYISSTSACATSPCFNYAFTGAANPEDITGGRRTPVFASKIPDHRGLVLTSAITVELDEEDMVISRTGTGLSMKIQAKDCAQGGIFQMEPERGDGTRTRIIHTLATSATPGLTPFYFDNPNFRARVGQFLGSTTAPASRPDRRASSASRSAPGSTSPTTCLRDFVARDSAQVAERVPQPDCNTATPVTPSVRPLRRRVGLGRRQRRPDGLRHR